MIHLSKYKKFILFVVILIVLNVLGYFIADAINEVTVGASPLFWGGSLHGLYNHVIVGSIATLFSFYNYPI